VGIGFCSVGQESRYQKEDFCTGCTTRELLLHLTQDYLVQVLVHISCIRHRLAGYDCPTDRHYEVCRIATFSLPAVADFEHFAHVGARQGRQSWANTRIGSYQELDLTNNFSTWTGTFEMKNIWF
jgi:hypothetical protein